MDDERICHHHSGLVAKIDAACLKMDERTIRLEDKIISVKDSIEQARKDMERRLEGMNEFRAQLASQANTFVGRTEFDVELKRLCDRMETLRDMVLERRGSKTWQDYIVTIIISSGIFVLLHYIIRAV